MAISTSPYDDDYLKIKMLLKIDHHYQYTLCVCAIEWNIQRGRWWRSFLYVDWVAVILHIITSMFYA